MTTTTLPNDAISFVCTLVRDRSAIELDANKAYLIDARLAPLAKQHGFASTADFILGAKQNRQPVIEKQLVEALTTNETSFFRDSHPFEALKKHLIPEIRKHRANDRSLNIWSAACSTGQELYSIAMLIRENFPDLLNWNINLLGTDLSDQVLARAQAGDFAQVEMNRGLPAPLLVKYFKRHGMHWTIIPEIRAWATFRKLNLIDQWSGIPTMDVIFLRNVLIYFSPATKKQILQKIRRVMAPHGILFLGAAETTTNLDDSFVRYQIDNSVFYRLN